MKKFFLILVFFASEYRKKAKTLKPNTVNAAVDESWWARRNDNVV